MVFSYYPGCTLSTTGKKLNEFALSSAKVLGFELEEINEWQCCGAVFPLGSDEISSKLSVVRALKAASDKGQDLITLCAACFHVFKQVNEQIKNDTNMQTVVKNYDENLDYKGETTVLHYMEVLKNHVGFEKIKGLVKNPLTRQKIGAYYGCMLLRPSDIMMFDDPENPTIFEDFIKCLGAEPVIYPYRNECCGGYRALQDKNETLKICEKIVSSALKKGTETLITACPLCKFNVAKLESLPIKYFTELLAYALGVADDK